eukprot:3421034-Pyramimonas_sp.AAC.3
MSYTSSRHYVPPAAKIASAQANSYAEKKKAAMEKAAAIKEERRRKALEEQGGSTATNTRANKQVENNDDGYVPWWDRSPAPNKSRPVVRNSAGAYQQNCFRLSSGWVPRPRVGCQSVRLIWGSPCCSDIPYPSYYLSTDARGLFSSESIEENINIADSWSPPPRPPSAAERTKRRQWGDNGQAPKTPPPPIDRPRPTSRTAHASNRSNGVTYNPSAYSNEWAHHAPANRVPYAHSRAEDSMLRQSREDEIHDEINSPDCRE